MCPENAALGWIQAVHGWICPGLTRLGQSVAYPLQGIAVNPSLCQLLVIFLAIDTFSSLQLLSEWGNNAFTVIKIHRQRSASQTPCLQNEPVTTACEIGFQMTFRELCEGENDEKGTGHPSSLCHGIENVKA